MHRLRILGDAVLRQTARALEPGEAATTGTLQLSMRAALKAENGRGIAAPQLGSALQMFLLAAEHNTASSSSPSADEALLVINPRVLRRSRSWKLEWETCCSVPGAAATFFCLLFWEGASVPCLLVTSLRRSLFSHPIRASCRLRGAGLAPATCFGGVRDALWRAGAALAPWVRLLYCLAFDSSTARKSRRSLPTAIDAHAAARLPCHVRSLARATELRSSQAGMTRASFYMSSITSRVLCLQTALSQTRSCKLRMPVIPSGAAERN